MSQKEDQGDLILFTAGPFYLSFLEWKIHDMDTRIFWECRNKLYNNLSIDPYLSYIKFLLNGKIRCILWEQGSKNTSCKVMERIFVKHTMRFFNGRVNKFTRLSCDESSDHLGDR
jgi:hypothetical protein